MVSLNAPLWFSTTRMLIAWYHPFCPSIRCFCIVNTLHSREVQAFTKSIFPRLKRVRKVRHRAPYSHKIAVFVSFCQMGYFIKVTVCIIPQFLNKTFAIQRGALFPNDNKCFFYDVSPFVTLPLFLFSANYPSLRRRRTVSSFKQVSLVAVSAKGSAFGIRELFVEKQVKNKFLTTKNFCSRSNSLSLRRRRTGCRLSLPSECVNLSVAAC